jgi:4-amino-4-deoxy-L-arabinose transferase-like glycosyltransferase
MTNRSLRGADVGFLVVLIILGAGLRLYRLNTGLWYDEIVTVLNSVRPPLREIVSHFPSNNDHPLYSVLAHVAVIAFGEEPWALRLPAVLFGVLTIPIIFALGLVVTNRLEAGAAALILTVSYHHIWFSQNARGYTLLLCAVLLSTYAMIRWFDTGRKAFLLSYAVVTALGAYSHLTMVLVSVSHAVACGWDAVRHGSASRVRAEWQSVSAAFVGAGLLSLLLYAPMLQDVSAFFTTETVRANEVATPAWALIATLRGLAVGFGTAWAGAIGAFVLAVGSWSYVRQRPTVALLFLLPLPVTVLLALAMSRPIFPRFVFFAIGALLLVTVRGAAVLGAWMARLSGGRLASAQAAAVMIGLLTAGAVALSARSLPYGYRYPKQDYAQAVAFVEHARDGTARVAAIGETGATPVVEYLGRSWQRVDDASQFRQLRVNGGELWVIYTFPAYIEANQPELWALLQRECEPVREFEGTVAGGTIIVQRCS